MLVITRRPDESIRIGDDVVITVVKVSGDKVRIGVTAPQELLVLRQEVLDRTLEKPTTEQ